MANQRTANPVSRRRPNRWLPRLLAPRLWFWILPLTLALIGILSSVRDPGSGTVQWPGVRLVGPEELVFDWSRDACEDVDVPDAPARALRDARGRVQLYASHYVTRRFVGPSLDEVRHECKVVMQSGYNGDPAAFDDREWLTAPFTEDGTTIHALVHNEYQGDKHPGRCPSGDYQKCWYNSITTATSTDAGESFSQPAAPAKLAATLPYQYVPDAGPFGVFQPSNIVEKDGWYYAMVMVGSYQRQQYGSCLIRTRNLAEPSSWRAWDGSDFTVGFVDPYPSPPLNVANHLCEPVDVGDIETMTHSLTYNTYYDRYMLVGVSGEYLSSRRRTVWGIYFALSKDLIEWTRRQLIAEVELPWTFECGDRNPIYYPSVLDPDSGSRTFASVGRRAYLYFTRLKYPDCVPALERDLVRIVIEFSR